jgi:ribosome biogenesis GTPase A
VFFVNGKSTIGNYSFSIYEDKMVRVRYSFGSRHTGRIENIKKQRAKYPDVMKNVIEISDIVLEILDARFVEETRNLAVEEDVLKSGKKLVYVFNKCDLVSLRKLEKNLPRWMRPYVFVSATKGIGLGDLKSRIKMEAKRILAARKSSGEMRTVGDGEKKKHGVAGKKVTQVEKMAMGKRDENWERVHVGVIGVPNAGKSSVINFVTRKGVAKVGGKAGFTKGMQKIRMSENILILDTPGVIPESRYTTEKKGFAADVKIGARSYGDVRDPEGAVGYLIMAPEPVDSENLTEDEIATINECERSARAIDRFYGIDARGDSEFLIEELGRKKGFLGKGGVVDEDRTARLVLRDWQEGNIRVK